MNGSETLVVPISFNHSFETCPGSEVRSVRIQYEERGPMACLGFLLDNLPFY